MKRLCNFFVICIFVLLISAHSAAAKSDWVSVRTKNFVLLGDAGEKDLRRVALRLEHFRQSIKHLFPKTNLDKPIPTEVYVFSSHDSFRSFKPRRNGKIEDLVAGYFMEGRENVFMALTIEERSVNPYEVVFHEYLHYILDNNFDDPPLWLNEGLAEVYSQFKIEEKGKQLVVGAPASRHVYTLRTSQMLPLEKLFTVTHKSKEYSQKGKAGIFYAQSWALVHYLMFGNEQKRTSQFLNFISNLNSGITLEENFRKSFNADYKEIEQELRAYVNKFMFPVAIYNLGSELEFEKEIESRPLSEAEVEFRLGKLLLHLREFEDGEKRLRKSVALNSGFAPLRAWLGSLLTSLKQSAEAETHLAEAIKLDPIYYLGHLFQGDFYALHGRSDEAIAAYQKAIELNPNVPRSMATLAAYYAFLNQDEEAHKLYNRVLRIAPREGMYFYASSIVALRMRRSRMAALQAQTFLRQRGWDENYSPYAVLTAYFGWRQEKLDVEAEKILKAGLSKIDKSIWVYSIFRYLSREISADELLKLADDNNKQTEARTYIGMDLVLQDKTTDAVPYFRWVIANGNKSLPQYGLSRAELHRIEKSSSAN